MRLPWEVVLSAGYLISLKVKLDFPSIVDSQIRETNHRRESWESNANNTQPNSSAKPCA